MFFQISQTVILEFKEKYYRHNYIIEEIWLYAVRFAPIANEIRRMWRIAISDYYIIIN